MRGAIQSDPSPWWGVRDKRRFPPSSSCPPSGAPHQVFPAPSPPPLYQPPPSVWKPHRLQFIRKLPKPPRLSERSTTAWVSEVLMMEPQHLALMLASLYLLHLFQRGGTGSKG